MPRGPKTVYFANDDTTGDGAAYAAGDQIGGASSSNLEWDNLAGHEGSGELKSIVVTLETVAAAELDLVLYTASFTAGTNNAAFTENAADIGKSLGVVNIPSTAFRSMGGNVKRATIQTALPYTIPSGTKLFGNLIARGALTLTSNTVRVGLGVERA